MNTWTIFYWALNPAYAPGGPVDKFTKNIVGSVEAPDVDTALRQAREEYGDYDEVGYRLRAERQKEEVG